MNPFATVPQTLRINFRRTMPLLWVVLCVVSCCRAQDLRAPKTPQLPTAKSAYEIHAVFRVSGQPMGSYREKATTEIDGGTKTLIDSDLIFNRMGSKLEMKSSSQYEETSDGHLKVATGDVSSSQQATHLEVLVGKTSLQIKTTTGEKTYERNTPLTRSLLGPEGARRLVVSRCQAPGDTVSYDTFFPELGTVVTVTDVLLGSEEVTTDQGKISGLKIEQAVSAMPSKATLWLDQNGWLLRQTVPSPFGDIEAIRSNASSEQHLIQGAALPEETFTQSIIKSNLRLPQERFIESIRLKIIQQQPELGWPNLETENQHVLEKRRNYVVLEVTRVKPKKTKTLPAATAATLTPYLSANALLQSDDPNIERITKSVVGNERNTWKAARALQLWTNENMHFDLGIALAPASEVARDRRGTCFGYAMLLGALARVAGIPSRLRMGYVYAGGVWGGHAWIDVRIGSTWIPLDGALYTPGSADAARFSFFTSALEEGTLVGIGSLAQLFGHADIKILQYTVAGKRVDVPEGAAPFTIESDTYHNPWLGFSIAKPPAFTFSESDLAWPQTTVIAMEGPQGQKVELRNLSASVPTPEFDAVKRLRDEGIEGACSTIRIAGKKTLAVSSAQNAGAVLLDRGNVWMFTATGAGAGKLLERISSSVTLVR